MMFEYGSRTRSMTLKSVNTLNYETSRLGWELYPHKDQGKRCDGAEW